MVIDPVCSLVFEAESEEQDIMKRKPRDPEAPLFGRSLIVWSVMQGVLAFLIVAGVCLAALNRGLPANEVRALVFFSLVLNIVALIFVNRSSSASIVAAITRPNKALVKVLFAVGLMLATTLLWPWATSLLRFGSFNARDFGVSIASGVLLFIALELAKPAWRRFQPA